MKTRDFDGIKALVEKVRLAERHEDTALKAKKTSQAKGYRIEKEMWQDALAIALTDGVSRRHPGEEVTVVLPHHVCKLLNTLGPAGPVTGPQALDEIEKIVAFAQEDR